MKIKVGDKVKFLNDTGSGQVTRIIDQKTALVQIDGGFEVPWLMHDLVLAGGSYQIEGEEDENEDVTSPEKPRSFSETIEESQTTEIIEDEVVMLAFSPEESSAEFNTYLINSSSYHFKYTISRQQNGELILFHEGNLEPGIKINLGNYQPGNINDQESFRIQGIFYNAGFYRHLSPVDVVINISAKEMYDSSNRVETDFFHEKVLSFDLYNWKKKPSKPEMNIDSEQLRKAMLSKGDVKPAKEKKKTISEVDLHIQELVDKHSGMENAEILDIQMAKFRTSLESAIIHKEKRIVFIHGVGNGKLKHEIRRTLEHEYKNLRFQDASFAEYGYGATLVLI